MIITGIRLKHPKNPLFLRDFIWDSHSLYSKVAKWRASTDGSTTSTIPNQMMTHAEILKYILLRWTRVVWVVFYIGKFHFLLSLYSFFIQNYLISSSLNGCFKFSSSQKNPRPYGSKLPLRNTYICSIGYPSIVIASNSSSIRDNKVLLLGIL